jgi:hypothetical protein
MRRYPRDPDPVEVIEVNEEHAPAMSIGWKRAEPIALVYGLPAFLRDALKPLLVSIYMQGCVDGVNAAERTHKGESNGLDNRRGRRGPVFRRLLSRRRSHEGRRYGFMAAAHQPNHRRRVR